MYHDRFLYSSSFAIILIGKGELVVSTFLSSCSFETVRVQWLFLRLSRVGLQCYYISSLTFLTELKTITSLFGPFACEKNVILLIDRFKPSCICLNSCFP